MNRVSAVDRRKKRKQLGFLCLGMDLGKLGLGKLGLGYPGSVSGLVSMPDSGGSVIFYPDLSLVSSTLSVFGLVSLMISKDSLMVAKESSTVFEISDECSSITDECSSIFESSLIFDIYDECLSPGFAENKLIGVVTVVKLSAISTRKDSEA
jgi:hypothetical protein